MRPIVQRTEMKEKRDGDRKPRGRGKRLVTVVVQLHLIGRDITVTGAHEELVRSNAISLYGMRVIRIAYRQERDAYGRPSTALRSSKLIEEKVYGTRNNARRTDAEGRCCAVRERCARKIRPFCSKFFETTFSFSMYIIWLKEFKKLTW